MPIARRLGRPTLADRTAARRPLRPADRYPDLLRHRVAGADEPVAQRLDSAFKPLLTLERRCDRRHLALTLFKQCLSSTLCHGSLHRLGLWEKDARNILQAVCY